MIALSKCKAIVQQLRSMTTFPAPASVVEKSVHSQQIDPVLIPPCT
jgi:hypothetical protein